MTEFVRPPAGEDEGESRPQVLIPYWRAHAISINQAAHIANRSASTIKDWCKRYYIGRRIGGQWTVCRVALQMFLEGNWTALNAYLAGDRQSALVRPYF